MAILISTPIEKDGKIYDKLAAYLALSPIENGTGFGASIAVRLVPYRIGQQGPESLEEYAQSVVYGDALKAAETDPVVAQFLSALEAAGQTFVLSKGI